MEYNEKIIIVSPKKTPKLSLNFNAMKKCRTRTPEYTKSPVDMQRFRSPNQSYFLKIDFPDTDNIVLNVKPLGMSEKLNKWIDSTKKNPAMLNSPTVSNK